MIGTYSNNLTNTFRKVNNVFYIIYNVLAVIALITLFISGVAFITLGIVAMTGGFEIPPEIVEFFEQHVPWFNVSAGIGAAVMTGGIVFTVFAICYALPMIIVTAIARKHNMKPDYNQFIGLAIVTGIFGMYLQMAFSIVIYIFEKRNANRSKVVDAQ